MTVETLKPNEFMGRYGGQLWVDKNTIAVVVGTAADVRNYLSAGGFVRPYGVFANPNRGDAVEELSRDETDYVGMALDAAGGLSDESDALAERMKEVDGELGIGEKLGRYVPDSLKRLGATISLEGREHARIYQLDDGQYAAELHRDPGVTDYVDGERLWNGDVTQIFGGIGNALKNHYLDPAIGKLQRGLASNVENLFGQEELPEAA